MHYIRSQRYDTPQFTEKMMGPNPIKLTEELMLENRTSAGAVVCDLGSGQGITSAFLAQEYGFQVYACDLWSDPVENQAFFDQLGLPHEQLIPVKADALNLPFEPAFFDAVVSVDSYNYFGRDEAYLDEKLLPFLKKGGLIYLAIPGMKHDCPAHLPEVLLRSWTPEQLEYMHDAAWWRVLIGKCRGVEILELSEMESNEEVWADWLKQENEYAVNDRKAMLSGGGEYLNFIKIVLKKR